MATLHEIEEHWSILDLLDANEALTLDQEAKRKAEEKAAKGRK
jgi:hypothetical protein